MKSTVPYTDGVISAIFQPMMPPAHGLLETLEGNAVDIDCLLHYENMKKREPTYTTAHTKKKRKKGWSVLGVAGRVHTLAYMVCRFLLNVHNVRRERKKKSPIKGNPRDGGRAKRRKRCLGGWRMVGQYDNQKKTTKKKKKNMHGIFGDAKQKEEDLFWHVLTEHERMSCAVPPQLLQRKLVVVEKTHGRYTGEYIKNTHGGWMGRLKLKKG